MTVEPGSVPAALPANEAERLDALRSYRILDTLPEPVYDDLVLIASTLCGTPIALLSLVDEKRQFIKANVGLPVRETSRDVSFCAHTILEPRPLVVEDALSDPRFQTNPLVVNDPSIRFYAGVPLVNPDGHALGALCAIDRVPRALSAEQKNALEALGRQVALQLELRRSLILARGVLNEKPSGLTPMPVSRATNAHEAAERARVLLQERGTSPQAASRIRDLLARLERLQGQTP